MDVMIIIKWLNDFKGVESTAPSIVTNMIDVFLGGGVVPMENRPLIGDRDTQQKVSVIFVLIALITIPWMLVPKPFLEYKKLQKSLKAQSTACS